MEGIRHTGWRPPSEQPSGSDSPRRYARLNPYRQVLDNIREQLLALGFDEVSDGAVLPELWNMDALFLPQRHPARDAVFYVRDPVTANAAVADRLPQAVVERTRRVHLGDARIRSHGRGEILDPERARRLLLRSHATATIARLLADGEPLPGRYFTISRCFRRNRRVDAQHTPDFFMIDCAVAGEDVTFSHLLDLLRLCAREIAGVEDIRFVPGFEPFVEPSVYVGARGVGTRHFAGGGLLRPEVLAALGLEMRVAALWLGVNAIAMSALELVDVRRLFPDTLEAARAYPTVHPFSRAPCRP